MKKKIVYIPTSNFDKELFVKIIYKYKDIDFIGTALDENSLLRFIKLYKPDFILFYSSIDSLSNHLQWCTRVTVNKYNVTKVFILDDLVEKYSPLCIRAGANIVFSTDKSIDYILKSLKKTENIGIISLYLISKLTDINKLVHTFDFKYDFLNYILKQYLILGMKLNKIDEKMCKSVKNWLKYKFFLKKKLKTGNLQEILVYMVYHWFLPKKR